MNQKLIVGLLGLGSVGLIAVGSFFYMKMDRVPPKITIPEEMISYSSGEDEAILLENVTAYDDVDLDVTSSLIVESVIPIDDNEHAKVIYAAKDSSNNITKEERTILYNSSEEQGGKISSDEDTDNTDESNLEDTDLVANTPIETNSPETQDEMASNTEVDENGDIINLDTSPLVSNGTSPVIRLNKYKVTQSVGSIFDFVTYVDDIVDDVDDRSTLFARIQLAGEYNINVAGTYVLEFYVRDTDSNESNREIFTLVVQ